MKGARAGENQHADDPPVLTSMAKMEMFNEKSCLSPFKWIKMPLLERQSQDKSLPMTQNKGESND